MFDYDYCISKYFSRGKAATIHNHISKEKITFAYLNKVQHNQKGRERNIDHDMT